MPHKATEYKIQSVVVCDDVRREESGKHILIGVYNRIIIFPAFPAFLMQLFVHIAISIKSESATEFRFKIVDATGRVLSDTKQPYPEIDQGVDSILSFRITGIAFEKETEIDILFGIDREPETVATLTIRLPSSDAEQARISRRTRRT